MKKNILGKSGIEVSNLCYGTLALSIYHANLHPDEACDLLVYAYINKGINFWDTAELYETYQVVGLALKKIGKPDDIIISSRSYAKTYDDMALSVDNCLKSLNKNNIQIFGMHEVQASEFEYDLFRPKAFEALTNLKQKGKIKAISLTTHSAKVVKMAADIQEIDVIMPLINYKGIGIKDGTLNDMEKAIDKAKKNNKGLYAMKILAGGYLIENILNSISYITANKNIDSLAIGMVSVEEINFNSYVVENSKLPDDQNSLTKNLKRIIHIEPWCEGCQNCIHSCPQGALILEYGQAKVIHEKCVRCGYCVSACKDFFIKFLNIREQ